MPRRLTDYLIAERPGWTAFAVFMVVFGGMCPAAVANKIAPCTLEWLPDELQVHLKTGYSSWKIQDLPSLSVTAKERWQGESRTPGQMEPECPGVAVGKFKTSQLSYAVLLVPIEKPDAAYRLVIFTLSGRNAPVPFRPQTNGITVVPRTTSYAECILRRFSARNG